MKSVLKRDLIAGILFVLVAVLLLWWAIPYGIREPNKIKFAALSPSYYPRLVSYCLCAFGLLLLVTRLVSRKTAKAEPTSPIARPHVVWICLALLLTLSGYYFSLEWLGFIVSSTIALFLLLLLAGERKWSALLLIPLLLPLALHLFFTQIANIPIPSGILHSYIQGA